jgi:hypothetical protein
MPAASYQALQHDAIDGDDEVTEPGYRRLSTWQSLSETGQLPAVVLDDDAE